MLGLAWSVPRPSVLHCWRVAWRLRVLSGSCGGEARQTWGGAAPPWVVRCRPKPVGAATLAGASWVGMDGMGGGPSHARVTLALLKELLPGCASQFALLLPPPLRKNTLPALPAAMDPTMSLQARVLMACGGRVCIACPCMGCALSR
jgi:hypothetical protein